MKYEKDNDEIIDIPFAKRTYLETSNQKQHKISLLILFLFLIMLSVTGYSLRRSKLLNLNSDISLNKKNNDKSLLGHLPYEDISKKKLVTIEPNIQVHSEMSESLLKMRRMQKSRYI